MANPLVKSVFHDIKRILPYAILQTVSNSAEEHRKIQKAVELAGVDVDDLVEIDESVEKVLAAVTRLELALQLKLDLFHDCLCPEARRYCCAQPISKGAGIMPAPLLGWKCLYTLKKRFSIAAYLDVNSVY